VCWWQAPRDHRRHCRPSLRRKSARRGAGSVEPGTQVLEGSPAPQQRPARHATATVARVTPCDSVARGLVLSHLSALAARETNTRQRSSRGHLLHYFFTTPAPPVQSGRAQAATRRECGRPTLTAVVRSRLSRSAALPRHERAASSRRRESGDYMPGRRSANAPAVPW
jgi:hypothetical protein